jgi:hypothetical protein
MSVTDKVSSFITQLQRDGEELFPYLANKNWKRGDQVFYSGPHWDEKEVTAAITTLLQGKWLPAGEEVNKFERAFSKQFEFAHSVMVNSGSSANLVMIAALKKYFDWQDGDEIIVCACGFPTTINPIIQNGLKPVFVDIDYSDLNWDLDQIRDKITTKTRALFSSPVLGNPYNFDKFLDIVHRYNLEYIADNCDSLEVNFLPNMPSQRLVLSIQRIISVRSKAEWFLPILKRLSRSLDRLPGGVVDATV